VIVTSILENAGNALGEALPRIGGALVLLVVGLVVARIAGLLTRRALHAVGVDDLGERFGVHDLLARVGIERPLSRIAGRIVRLVLAVVVVFAAVSLLGLGVLAAALNQIVLFLPNVIVAIVLVVAGAIVAQLVGRWIDRLGTQLAIGGPLGRIAEFVVFAIFLLTALAQLGISTEILTMLVWILLVAVAVTVALAFGLGSRDVARQVSAGRYVGGAFEIGQTISVDGVRGEIVALESAATIIRADDGAMLRVPNHLLLESVVTLYERPAEEPTAGLPGT
jgi:small-conductance mechanosensitive channel